MFCLNYTRDPMPFTSGCYLRMCIILVCHKSLVYLEYLDSRIWPCIHTYYSIHTAHIVHAYNTIYTCVNSSTHTNTHLYTKVIARSSTRPRSYYHDDTEGVGVSVGGGGGGGGGGRGRGGGGGLQ